MQLPKTKTRRNCLYALRRIRGYRQKQLAHLLSTAAQMISRYEAGTVLPSLETAMMLEIVLGARLAELYPELYRSLERRAWKRELELPSTLGRPICGRLCTAEDNCTYGNSGKRGGSPR